MWGAQPAQEKRNASENTTVDAILGGAGGLDGGHYSFGGCSLKITERCRNGILRDVVGTLSRARARRYTTRGDKRNHPCRQHGSVGVEFASCVRTTCAVSIDVHGLILTDFFAYARTIQEIGDGQTRRGVTIQERRNNHNLEPLVNVQQSNIQFHALNNIIPSLPLHRLEPTPSANLWPMQFAPEPTPSAIP